MSTHILIKLGALAAIAAGLCRIVAAILPTGLDLVGLEWFYLVIDILLMLGLVGVYAYQHSECGVVGLIGFVVSAIGIEAIGGPDGKIGTVDIYATGASVIGVGMVLFGIGSWCGRKLPRYVAASWILSTAVGVAALATNFSGTAYAIAGALFGIGFVGAGVHIVGQPANGNRPAPTRPPN